MIQVNFVLGPVVVVMKLIPTCPQCVHGREGRQMIVTELDRVAQCTGLVSRVVGREPVELEL